MEDDIPCGTWIRWWRKEYRLSQAGLAKGIDYGDNSRISRFENGEDATSTLAEAVADWLMDNKLIEFDASNQFEQRALFIDWAIGKPDAYYKFAQYNYDKKLQATRGLDSEARSRARTMLEWISYCAPKPIPYLLLVRACGIEPRYLSQAEIAKVRTYVNDAVERLVKLAVIRPPWDVKKRLYWSEYDLADVAERLPMSLATLVRERAPEAKLHLEDALKKGVEEILTGIDEAGKNQLMAPAYLKEYAEGISPHLEHVIGTPEIADRQRDHRAFLLNKACGHLLFALGLVGDAIAYFKRALQIVHELPNNPEKGLDWNQAETLAGIYQDLGVAHHYLHDYEDAERNLQAALEWTEKAYDEKPLELARRKINLCTTRANISAANGKHDEAKALLDTAMEQLKSFDNILDKLKGERLNRPWTGRFQTAFSEIMESVEGSERLGHDRDPAIDYIIEELDKERRLYAKQIEQCKRELPGE